MPESSKFAGLPAQVYLDSADYSRLTDAKGDESWQVATTERLLRAVAGRQIDIRYSAIHIIEASPKDMTLTDPGVRRLQKIGELCGGMSLRYFSDVVAEELQARAYERQSTTIRPSVQSDNGEWMPRISGFVDDLERDREAQFGWLKSLSRDQRRKLIRRGKNSMLSAASIAQFVQKISETHPGFERCGAILPRFLFGQATALDVEREFLRPFTNPRSFARLLLSNYDKVSGILTWLRKVGIQNTQRMNDTQLRLASTFADMDGMAFNAIAQSRLAALRDDLILGRVSDLARLAEIDTLEPPFSSYDDAARTAPTYFALADALVMVLSRSLASKQTPRKSKASDAGDILHAAHIPHVDYFRCDSTMTDCFRDVGQRFSTRIVGSLDELLDHLRI